MRLLTFDAPTHAHRPQVVGTPHGCRGPAHISTHTHVITRTHSQVVLPEYGLHAFMSVLFLLSIQITPFLINLPLLAYNGKKCVGLSPLFLSFSSCVFVSCALGALWFTWGCFQLLFHRAYREEVCGILSLFCLR